jgi:hypothetical protein
MAEFFVTGCSDRFETAEEAITKARETLAAKAAITEVKIWRCYAVARKMLPPIEVEIK